MIFEVLWPRAGGVPECSYSVPGTSGAWIGDAPHRGDEVRHEATPLPRPSGHRMAESVADLIYGQIHLYPSEVHLGLLSGMEALDVVLWNATFAPVQLVGVNSASSAGTTLSGFRPGVLPPTGALKGLLTVLSSGPAQQDTTYTFVTGIGERSLTITASRVLLFPFWPDWSDGLEIDYAFDTVLTRGENGDEQRRPLAKRPLRTLRATICERAAAPPPCPAREGSRVRRPFVAGGAGRDGDRRHPAGAHAWEGFQRLLESDAAVRFDHAA